jgi:pimeloyl-ACP methyl ester carboxylesterase
VNVLRTHLLVMAIAVFCGSCSAKDSDAPQLTQEQEYPCEEQEVFFRNQKDNITLAGTLTIPDLSRPLASVILIPNSSTDRDETVGRHRPLHVLATHLAQSGLIVLRSDSRGIGQSEGTAWPANTKENIASDIEAAISYLRGRPETAPTKIGLIGHSEGASVATKVAGKTPDVAFVIMLGGPGLPGSRVLCSQVGRVARAFGVQDSVVDRYVRLIQAATKILHEQSDAALARTGLTRLFDEYLDQSTETERAALTVSGYAIPDSPAGFADGMLLPWMKDFLLYDPHQDLRRVKCPLLSLIGEKDMQVDADSNSMAIHEALQEGGNQDATVVVLPDLNHLLQTAQTGSPAEYREISETMSETALETIRSWILTQVPYNHTQFDHFFLTCHWYYKQGGKR